MRGNIGGLGFLAGGRGPGAGIAPVGARGHAGGHKSGLGACIHAKKRVFSIFHFASADTGD